MTSKRIRIGLRIPYELNTELILIAKEIGISKNALMLKVLQDYINHKTDQREEGEGVKENQRLYINITFKGTESLSRLEEFLEKRVEPIWKKYPPRGNSHRGW